MSGVSTATRSASGDRVAPASAVEAVGLRLGSGRAAGAQADDDVEAGIAQVERVRAALAAVADDGDAFAASSGVRRCTSSLV